MKQSIIAAFLVMLAGNIISAQQIITDPNAESRNVKAFHAIEISHAFTVFISQGNEEALAVSSSDAGYTNRIKTEVKNGVLRIWVEKDNMWKSSKKNLKAYVAVKNLEALKVNGACDIHIVGTLNATKLDIDLSGASNLKGKLEVNDLSVNLSGASDVTLSGKVTRLKIDASGASDIKSYDLVTDYCVVELSGVSSLKITVNKELSGRASGASAIHVKGDGTISEVKTSGVSSITRKT